MIVQLSLALPVQLARRPPCWMPSPSACSRDGDTKTSTRSNRGQVRIAARIARDSATAHRETHLLEGVGRDVEEAALAVRSLEVRLFPPRGVDAQDGRQVVQERRL